jgi:Reverse transcriptase (RNA-dependent DNA polymerase)
MQDQKNQPYYKLPPIGSIKSLSDMLGVKPEELVELAQNSDSLYKIASQKVKPDGTIRVTYDANYKLKKIQKKIKRYILDNVFYPLYIQGGIRDPENPRDYVNNARIHADKLIVISDDISGFFPSISKSVVRKIWQYLFNFPEDVACCLTELTTKDNELPQGASTSSHIANLVFWDLESELVQEFKSKGYEYTRFIDDVNVSSNDFLDDQEKSLIIKNIHDMFGRKGVKSNRRKLKIYTKGSGIRIHRLNAERSRITLPKRKRNAIRAAVKECEVAYRNDMASNEYMRLLRSVFGRVRHLKQFHAVSGNHLLNRLSQINNTGSKL